MPIEHPNGAAQRRAAQYLRMSTEHQRYSLENQSAAIALYAVSRGFEIVKTYQDSGKSGLRLKGRDGLKALLSDAIAGTADYECIIVLDISRWGRFQDPDQAAYYEFICRQAGVQVFYCGEAFENDLTPTSSIMKHLKRVAAAEYSRELSDKVRHGKRRLASKGFKQTTATRFAVDRLLVDQAGAPRQRLGVGERKALADDKVVFVLGDPAEVVTVRRIFRLYCSGRKSTGEITELLKKENAPRYNEQPWTPERVRMVLSNRIYCGTYIYGKTRVELNGVRRTFSEREWTCAEVLDPIVSKSTFAKAQAISRDHHRHRPILHEEMFTRAKQLLEREGRLSSALLRQCPDTPGPHVYAREFGSLLALYALIGWTPTPPPNKHPSSRHRTNEELLAVLAAVFKKHGFLSMRLLRETLGTNNEEMLSSRFGSLPRAFALAGYDVDDIGRRAVQDWLRRTKYYAKPIGQRSRPPPELVRPQANLAHLSENCSLGRLQAIFRDSGCVPLDLAAAASTGPCQTLYRRRFGCAPIPHEPWIEPTTKPIKRPVAGAEISDEVLLEHLRMLHRKHGQVRSRIVDLDRSGPGPGTYRRRFGSVMAAFIAAGLRFELAARPA